MRKLWLNIKLFFFYFFRGLKNVDDVAFTAQKDTTAGSDSTIEQQQEVNSVYKDMLKGELTQEVIELRHEMYFSERRSKKYEYAGGGRAVKKNNVFDYKGKIEMSDGLPVVLVQDNREDEGSLMDFGIYHMGDKVELDEKAKGDLNNMGKKDFTIKIERDFTPRFYLERHVKKIVVKAIDDKHSLIDLYVPMYRSQFDNRDKFFQSELSKIYMGDLRSDLINFTTLSFITYNAGGVDDLIEYRFKNASFENILKFDGSYILRFEVENEIWANDLLDEMYDEATEEKSRNHEPRKNNTISAEVFLAGLEGEKYDTEQAADLLKELK